MAETVGDALSRVSGVPRAEVSEIFKQVKRNHQRLAVCDHHIFKDITPDKPLGKKYRCSRCQGEVDSQAYYWFTKGQEQARMGV